MEAFAAVACESKSRLSAAQCRRELGFVEGG